MFDQATHDALDFELVDAIDKHGVKQTPLSQRMNAAEKLVILVEEVGEVARALTYDEGDLQRLHDELIQVATMSAAWAQSIRRIL